MNFPQCTCSARHIWISLLLLLFDEPQPPLLLLLSESRHTTEAQSRPLRTGTTFMQACFSKQAFSVHSMVSW